MNSRNTARSGALTFIVLGLGISGCGGGGTTTAPTPTGTPPAAILVTGATDQYAGTESVAVTYASPSATNVNSNGAYSYVANQVVNAAAANAPAPFDVNRVTTYTVVTAPSSGELLLSSTSDTYESQTFAGATETIATAGSNTVTAGTDLTAALRLGSGPFNENSTTTLTYVTPQTDGVYPLQTGSSLTEPLARNQTTTTTDANAANTYGGGGTTTDVYNNDGSYTANFTAGNGSSSYQETVAASGTATRTTTTAANTQQLTIGTPSGGIIPVAVTNNGVLTNDQATDWYPGGGLAMQPLSLTTRTVVGPVTLPASCGFGAAAPAVIQVNSNTTTLNPFGSYTVTSQQGYNANGISVCRTSTSTTTDYSVTTGALTSTTVTTIAEALVASSQTITGVKRRITAAAR